MAESGLMFHPQQWVIRLEDVWDARSDAFVRNRRPPYLILTSEQWHSLRYDAYRRGHATAAVAENPDGDAWIMGMRVVVIEEARLHLHWGREEQSAAQFRTTVDAINQNLTPIRHMMDLVPPAPLRPAPVTTHSSWG